MKNLAGADWLAPSSIHKVFAALEQEGDRARAVGGAVRNTLLGVPVADVDIATSATPDVVIARCEAAGLKTIPTGVEHGTVTVLSEGTAYEVTTLREDVETFGRRAVVRFGRDWEHDARRRDFTLKALYADREGGLFDPLGGLEDCLNRRVRFIGNAEARIREDYLRVLRFFRIHAAYGEGEPDKDGLAASVRLREGLTQLSAERVGAEMKRLVAAHGAVLVLRLMNETGILEIVAGGRIPAKAVEDLAALKGLASLATEAGEAILGLAALAGPDDGDQRRIARLFRLSNAERDRMRRANREALLLADAPELDLLHRELVLSSRDTVIDGLLLAAARNRATSGDGRLIKLLGEAREWPVPEFPLNGRDLISAGVRPGPEIGQRLEAARTDWIASGYSLDRDSLLEKVVA